MSFLALKLFGAACDDGLLFGILPHWAKGLTFDGYPSCNITDFQLSQVWLIVANVTRIALALAGLVAVIFIIVGGVRYITSGGNPDNAKQALGTIMSAVAGLVIAIVASALVGFIAGIFT